MTGLDMLKRARELAYHHEKETGQHGTASMLFDLINEIERLREAAKGSAVIVNQAIAARDKAMKDAVDAEAQVVALSIDKGRLRKALGMLLDSDKAHAEAEMDREVKACEMCPEWLWAHTALQETSPKTAEAPS